MRVEDYYPKGKRWWVRLHEKGGKRHEMPAHHNARGLSRRLHRGRRHPRRQARAPSSAPRAGAPATLTGEADAPHRRLAHDPAPRRRRRALEQQIGCHTFRATGITAYLENGGTLENAQPMAAHESPRTTKLYDRTGDEITLDEVERITVDTVNRLRYNSAAIAHTYAFHLRSDRDGFCITTQHHIWITLRRTC